MQIIDGKAIADKTKAETAKRAQKFEKKHGRKCGLAVVLIGNNPASAIYVNNKQKMCAEIGFDFFLHRLDEKVTQAEVLGLVGELCSSPAVDGILVQMPLPAHLDAFEIMEAIDPRKDVDGFTAINTGNLCLGRACIVPGTPAGCLALLKTVCPDMAGKHAVVVGRSNIVGKPMAQLLLQENCTVTVAHSKTVGLCNITKLADILVVAIGKPRFITADMVKPGAIVIDVGINRENDKILGDVDFENVKNVAGYITPVPKGVGPMTMAMLFENLLKLGEQHG